MHKIKQTVIITVADLHRQISNTPLLEPSRVNFFTFQAVFGKCWPKNTKLKPNPNHLCGLKSWIRRCIISYLIFKLSTE